jgi:hypothetical protein
MNFQKMLTNVLKKLKFRYQITNSLSEFLFIGYKFDVGKLLFCENTEGVLIVGRFEIFLQLGLKRYKHYIFLTISTIA